MLGTRHVLLVFFAASVGCYPFDRTLCGSCEVGGCEGAESCVQGICVTATNRCGILEYTDGCGLGPPCSSGLECFEDVCRTPVEVVVGDLNSCVRWASGRVSCWGDNRRLQTTAETTESLDPVVIEGLDDATALTVGEAHVCVLHEDRHASCWGDNSRGQLGNVTDLRFDRAFENEGTPRPVGVEEPLSDIVAGRWHTCALTVSGHVWCWGSGTDTGRTDSPPRPCLLGDPDPANTQTPTQLADEAHRFTSLVAARYHTIGLTASGEAYAFGPNSYGQIDSDREPHCAWTKLPFDDVRLAAGDAHHTCVVEGTDRVRCIGADVTGDLATTGVTFDEPIAQLVGGLANLCVRLEGGRVLCWGSPLSGILPGSSTDDELQWTPREIPNASAAAMDVANHACLIRDGDGVFCWGDSHVGQLGDGRTKTRLPTLVAKQDLTRAAVGSVSVCAVDRDERLWCWGDDRFGAAGAQTGLRHQPITKIELSPVQEVGVGRSFGCARRLSGVWCWGTYVSGATPDLAAAQLRLVPGTNGAKKLSVGWDHACVVRSDGTVACWGSDVRGAVSGTPNNVYYDDARPMAGVTSATFVAAGDGNSCVVQQDGRYTCQGTFGFETDFDLPDITELIAGDRYNCARRENGSAICWGENEYGRLGDGTDRFRERPLNPVRGIDDVVDIDAYFEHACAVGGGGEVWCWGQDARLGRLGVGPTSNQLAPLRVSNVPPATAVAVGRDGACVITGEGLYCWGEDLDGHLTGMPPISTELVRVNNLF